MIAVIYDSAEGMPIEPMMRWFYYVADGTVGMISADVPETEGDYEMRLFRYKSAEETFIESLSFTVSGGQPKTTQSFADAEVGDIINLGGMNNSSGKRQHNWDWLILATLEDKALVLSTTIFDERWYHGNRDFITWEESDIRAYLNGDFYENNFAAAEKEKIAEAQIINNDNPWYDTEGGNDTTDKVFLLSLEEVVLYLGNGDPISAREINDEHNSARAAKNIDGQAAGWWLRSPGGYEDMAAIVRRGGSINVIGLGTYDTFGVRPAMWVKLD
jgi:hypothetical protein